MIISYYGQGMVKVAQGEKALLFNPVNRKMKADIVLFSGSRGDAPEGAFVIGGPGEYEVGGVFVRGIAGTDGHTIYAVKFEEIALVHLGQSSVTLKDELVEQLGEVDILFVPVAAAKALTVLEPKLAIPLHWKNEDELKRFLHEAGVKNGAPVESLTLKRKDLADKEGEVVVIKSA